MDMAVPQSVAADNHDRVADRRPCIFESLDGFVGRFEEVHDLVAKLVDSFLTVRQSERDAVTERVGWKVVAGGLDGRNGSSVEMVKERIEEHDVAGAAGVDDTSSVEASATAAPSRAVCTTSRSDAVSGSAAAASAAPRATVRIVPSIGFMTAPYAAVDAAANARANVDASTASWARHSVDSPRKIWHKITPEFPRAPISEPWAIACDADATVSGPFSAAFASSVTTASDVNAMLVPVSPSGTG